jgi:hypothetical protein
VKPIRVTVELDPNDAQQRALLLQLLDIGEQVTPTAEPRLDEPPWPQAAGTDVGDPAGCPVHHVPWKWVPAGVSKRTGKPYKAFQACSEPGCNEKPRQAA